MTTIDPRLGALYNEVTELVGISGKRDQELMKLLSEGDDEAKKKLKMVSVVGLGGLGKTTLVKTVYDNIKGKFDHSAFVPVGRSADAKKVLMDILLDLGIYQNQFTMMNERQLIDRLREYLENRRYLIVIDDIWDGKLWGVIKWAFSSSNNLGSRLITTTRIVGVSKLCCSTTNGSIYQMEPLSGDDSQRLFYKRIFSHERGCPREFEKVSIDILKKCGGVPLAIITIASLLASDRGVKPMDKWHALLESFGRGLTEDPSVEEMLRILSFSYYDLPSHLKTCLLYLSMFPEDFKIRKDQLIWMWIAESFVQCDNAETFLFDIGETYFNELVNRNMILPVYARRKVEACREVEACRVHDMVLDLISSLSREDNFVTILNGIGDSISSRCNVRRLSLQNDRKGELQTTPIESVSLLKVRSIATFEPAINLMPPFSSFFVLRVLDFTGCNLGNHNHLNIRELGNLLHLRYLGLAKTEISEVPEEVGKLKFLQVLDLSGNKHIEELPSTINKLRRLMRLLVDSNCERFPDGLGNLTSMEVLSEIHCDSLSIVNELGSMERLTKLGILFGNLSFEMMEAFVESLGKMSNLRSVVITRHGVESQLLTGEGVDSKTIDLLGEGWVPPRSLREFVTYGLIFSTVPTWIRRNPLHLSHLMKIKIFIEDVRQEDLDILGRLPALRNLNLWSFRQIGQPLVGADGFRCLASFMSFSQSAGLIMFQPGAMPNVEKVELWIKLRVAIEEAAGKGGDCFHMGFGNLLSLRKVIVNLNRWGLTVGETKQLVAALENELRAHPSRPYFRVIPDPLIPHGAPDDDVMCHGNYMEEEEEEEE
ncbi:disease resistance protein RGA5-like [Lolium rigidum]|uniref:disease resistance protein RGA5-like n=1 Tax=Lolium rigidum TaxID=89674 RepID=UPI001F5DAB22|nr:disease resistance protein RGA5-like [Lolium rigidum]